MRRKDYILLAEWLAGYRVEGILQPEPIQHLARDLCRLLKQNNPGFDEELFLRNAGE